METKSRQAYFSRKIIRNNLRLIGYQSGDCKFVDQVVAKLDKDCESLSPSDIDRLESGKESRNRPLYYLEKLYYDWEKGKTEEQLLHNASYLALMDLKQIFIDWSYFEKTNKMTHDKKNLKEDFEQSQHEVYLKYLDEWKDETDAKKTFHQEHVFELHRAANILLTNEEYKGSIKVSAFKNHGEEAIKEQLRLWAATKGVKTIITPSEDDGRPILDLYEDDSIDPSEDMLAQIKESTSEEEYAVLHDYFVEKKPMKYLNKKYGYYHVKLKKLVREVQDRIGVPKRIIEEGE